MDLPLFTQEDLQQYSEQDLVSLYLKLQQICLQDEDQIDTLRRIVDLQTQLLEIAGFKGDSE